MSTETRHSGPAESRRHLEFPPFDSLRALAAMQFPVLIFLIDELAILELWPAHPFPVVVLATLAGTVACAATSYYLLERPLMRRERARNPPPAGDGVTPVPLYDRPS